MRQVTVRDPVHGDVELTGEEIGLVDTPEVQRLRGIKQLGTACLVYPGAVHTRFEHSIGTLHMAGKLLDAIERWGTRDSACETVSAEARRVLRIAALLHDVTHIPFGHNIEDQTGLLERHDRPERFAQVLGDTDAGKVLAALGLRDTVLAVLNGRTDVVPPWWCQVLSDTIDADLLDYLRRDAYFTGLHLGYDDRLIGHFRVDKKSRAMFVDCEKQGMLREDVLSEILRILETRYHFSERVYYHHTKIAAGALLARMVEVALRAGALKPADLQRATDQSLVDRLGSLDLGEAGATARLRRFAARLERRQLPKRVLVLPVYLNRDVQQTLLDLYFTPGKPQSRFDWEAQMEQEAKRRLGRELDVILYCPNRQMQLKEARTLVRLPGSGERIRPLADFARELPRLMDLQDSYPRLWKLYVFTSEGDFAVRRELQRMCLEALPKGCVNALAL
jgi:hypothetical protein